MCANNEIGVKKGKLDKRKEERIGKLPFTE